MTFNEFIEIFQTPFLQPWENDYYYAVFENTMTTQEFLDHAYESIDGLVGLWFHILGNTVYFIVPKGTTVPEGFALSVNTITDIPEQPVTTPTE